MKTRDFDEYLDIQENKLIGSISIDDEDFTFDDFIVKLKEADSHLKEKGFSDIQVSLCMKYANCVEARIYGKKPAPPAEKQSEDELIRNSHGYARYLEMKKEYSHLDRVDPCAYIEKIKGGASRCKNKASIRHLDWKPECDLCNDWEGKND